MGMIGFYAGLFVGILVGCLFSSLWAFSLARREAGTRPDQCEGLAPVDLLELEARQPPSLGPDAVQVGARGIGAHGAWPLSLRSDPRVTLISSPWPQSVVEGQVSYFDREK